AGHDRSGHPGGEDIDPTAAAHGRGGYAVISAATATSSRSAAAR
ncbi:MAG: hypothetical protein QOJ07_2555, partial [Thermoleophilaceae bacterium]|nr:hypothetical protein [Thermoleophilaceae bacterium]